MRRDFLHLVAVMDWHSRKMLGWRLSNSLDTAPCMDALENALANHDTLDLFNADQGCQFTSESFTGVLKQNGIKISMDGKGRWMDNVFIERLWRSLKYEEVYLKAYDSVAHATESIGTWVHFYLESNSTFRIKLHNLNQTSSYNALKRFPIIVIIFPHSTFLELSIISNKKL